MTIFSRFFAARPRLAHATRILAAVLFLLGVLWLYQYRCEAAFVRAYTAYASRAASHAEAAFLPGSVSNQLRSELNQTLADVLGRKMGAGERADLSQRGLQLLKEADAQVDAIGTGSNAVAAAIGDLERAAHLPGNIAHRDERLQILTLAHSQESAIEDIRGLSYRSNFHAAEIFTRILTDRGELTRDYVLELNDQIPQLEAQFNKRANLYTDLEALRGKVTKLYTAIEG